MEVRFPVREEAVVEVAERSQGIWGFGDLRIWDLGFDDFCVKLLIILDDHSVDLNSND